MPLMETFFTDINNLQKFCLIFSLFLVSSQKNQSAYQNNFFPHQKQGEKRPSVLNNLWYSVFYQIVALLRVSAHSSFKKKKKTLSKVLFQNTTFLYEQRPKVQLGF